MVPEKMKLELKRFLSPKQVEDLSKQFDSYEKRVREAVKSFDVRGRKARERGQEQLEKFAAQVKRTSDLLEKQLKAFVNQEGRVLNKGLAELFTYFKKAQNEKPVAKKASAKTAKPKARAKTSRARVVEATAH